MEVMVIGAVVSCITKIVIYKLSSFPVENTNQSRDSREDWEKLKDNFTRINATLHDAGMQQINSMVVKEWLKKLENAAFETDNALDEFNYHLLTKGRKSIFSGSYFYDPLRTLGRKIKDINMKLDLIIQEATNYGIHQWLIGGVHAPGVASDNYASLETDSLTLDPIFIGRDDEVSKIVEMLTNPTEEVLSILPIVGMGGLGKTTLARNVFNHQKSKTHFGKRIWVHVSRDFDAVVIFKKILTNLKQEDLEVESREGLLKKIQEALKAKTYVLVLDDVWNEDQQKWEDFIKSWSGITSSKGNGIIVTTRNAGVGSLVKTLDMHLLNGLSEQECLLIIKDRAFGGGSITPDLEDIGKSIAERCQGLPLAANVVGGVLRGKSQDEWCTIKENWLSDDGGDENYISKILKLSFHHLPSPLLKKCFAYCSIFPKGAWIERKQLIELWMAEGFLQPSQTSDMETVGNQFFKVLLHNSLLQVVDRDEYGDVEHCRMHDLVHDVAGSISDHKYYKREESNRIPKEQAKWLRTLIYNGRISDMVFSDFKSLHAVTLTERDIIKLPDSIKELILLRYLDISDTHIGYLPNSIGGLCLLQTIRAHRCLALKTLPSTVNQLFNLRHIYIANETVLPPQLGKLTSLQTLPYFKVRDEEGHRIAELGGLKNLKGKLTIYNLEQVKGEEESSKACLFQRPGIVRLMLIWDYGGFREGETNDENVLKGLQPHPNLKMLEIKSFQGECFPSWTLKMAVCLEGRWAVLNNLVEIRLEHCSRCEEIPTLGHLPSLKSLYLFRLDKLKSIGASFYGIEECSSSNSVYKDKISVFLALERLHVISMPNLMDWEEVKILSGAQVKVFPCLEYLNISDCNQLRSAPSQFTSLKEFRIHGMNSGIALASICGIKLKTLTKLQISSIEGLLSLPDGLFHNNQNLSELIIRDCPKLRELPTGLHSLNSLESLYLERCDNLKSIPYSVGEEKSQGLMSLLRLPICSVLTNCFGVKEEPCAPLLEYLSIDARGSNAWDCVSFNEAVDGILRFGSHSLRTLYLTGKKDWESLPNQLQHLTSISELRLSSFGIEELPEWFGNLSSLQKLYLFDCRKLKHLPSVEAMRRLTNLTMLDISYCPMLKERCTPQGSDDDSEHSKISHISTIVMV